MKVKWPYLMLAVAIGLGLATTLLISRWMERQAELQTGPREEQLVVRPIVVAALDLVPGAKLREESLRVMKWPADSLPPGSQSDPSKLVNRVALQPIVSGEPIMEAKLAPEGTEGGLTAIIAPGKRAMSVKVDEIIGVAGFVMPGSYVDVLVVLEDSKTRHKGLDAAAQTILQNVKVLTSGQKIINEKKEPVLVNVVTVEVTPEEAEKLALASNRGRLQLALRNQFDREESQTYAIHTPQLIKTRYVPAVARKTGVVVEVYRGVKKTEEKF